MIFDFTTCVKIFTILLEFMEKILSDFGVIHSSSYYMWCYIWCQYRGGKRFIAEKTETKTDVFVLGYE